MTGLIGGVFYHGDALKPILDGLRDLAFRGSDGFGIAAFDGSHIRVAKTLAPFPTAKEQLERQLGMSEAKIAISEARFATHGRPSLDNTPPHHDCLLAVYALLDGVVAEYDSLSKQLRRSGHVLVSKNDAELVAHIVEENLEEGVKEALIKLFKRVSGYFATALLLSDGTVALATTGPKLFIGRFNDGWIFSNELDVLRGHVSEYFELPENSFAIISDELKVHRSDGKSIKARFSPIPEQVGRVPGGFNTFMEREIYEIPDALRRAYYVHQKTYLDLAANLLLHASTVLITGSGTSYYAGLIGSYYLARLAGIKSEVIYATEFIFYGIEKVTPGAVLIALSQSGKSTDVLRAVREARIRGGIILGITNNIGSPLMYSSNVYLPIGAGPEKAVPATKTFECQLLTLLRLALNTGLKNGKVSEEDAAIIESQLKELPTMIERTLPAIDSMAKKWAEYFKDKQSVFLASRGLNFPIALEGALKLKETAYIHAEGLEAGELRHGPKAIISSGFPVVIIVPKEEDAREDSYNLMVELRGLGAKIFAITDEEDTKAERFSDSVIKVPKVHDLLTPMLNVIPLQLLALRTAEMKGLPVDEPRGLAKYVIVKTSPA